jgi:type IV secretory pathway VirB2 component (pilin)
MFINKFKYDLNFAKMLTAAFCLMTLVMLIAPEFAFGDGTTTAGSAGPDGISKVLCNVVGQLQGTIGKAIATIAIIVLGVGLFMGKLSWQLAIATALGIGLIFGAAGVVGWLTKGTNAKGSFCPAPT